MENSPTPAMRDWKARWQRVAQKEAELLRATSDEVRLRQLWALFATARDEDWQTATPDEIAEVRRRWRVLRDKYRERTGSKQ